MSFRKAENGPRKMLPFARNLSAIRLGKPIIRGIRDPIDAPETEVGTVRVSPAA